MSKNKGLNNSKSKHVLAPIAHFFTDKYSLKNSGNLNIKLNTATYTMRQFESRYEKDKEEIVKAIGGNLEYYKIVENIKKSCSVSKDDRAEEIIIEKVFEALKKKASGDLKGKATKVDEDSDVMNNDFDWSYHVAFIDLGTAKAVMYDDKNKVVDHSVSYKTWEIYLRTLRKEIREIVQGNMVYGRIVYDPRDKKEIYKIDEDSGRTITYLNAHKMPSWRKKVIKEPKLPKMFVELMEHLFPNEECRNYVYHWLNFMMTSRNHCYLLLHGEQGIGKNTFTSVIQKLVGDPNFSYVNPSFWDDDKFNAELKYKRCVFFDETVIERKNTTSLRSFTNAQIAITEKGIDTKVYDNHASFIIANNLDKINHVLFDDRRFSVPVLGTEPIKTAYGQEWLDEIYEKIESQDKDSDFIANIGHWILNYGYKGDYNEKQPYLTESFYDIVEKALTKWQQTLINMIEARDTDRLYLNDIEDELSGTGRVKIENFLNSHLDRDGEKYGFVKQDTESGKRYININEKYWPEEIRQDSNTDKVEDFNTLDF